MDASRPRGLTAEPKLTEDGKDSEVWIGPSEGRLLQADLQGHPRGCLKRPSGRPSTRGQTTECSPAYEEGTTTTSCRRRRGGVSTAAPALGRLFFTIFWIPRGPKDPLQLSFRTIFLSFEENFRSFQAFLELFFIFSEKFGGM